jgi:ubiquinone/menaquinone biosynthesis C-methylase UbiE
MTAALYDSVIADFYDASPVVASRQKDVVFYRQTARQHGGPVLELGCGTGRVTTEIAAAGQHITGLDISEKMLERAAQKVSTLHPDERQRVTLLPGDMRRFALKQQFRLIIIPFRPFQHLLPVGEQLDCLACVRRHLAPGGKLIMDFFQTDAARSGILEGTFHRGI